MFSTGRKNRENFGQEIVLGNLSRKLMNVVRLGLIFLLEIGRASCRERVSSPV